MIIEVLLACTVAFGMVQDCKVTVFKKIGACEEAKSRIDPLSNQRLLCHTMIVEVPK